MQKLRVKTAGLNESMRFRFTQTVLPNKSHAVQKLPVQKAYAGQSFPKQKTPLIPWSFPLSVGAVSTRPVR